MQASVARDSGAAPSTKPTPHAWYTLAMLVAIYTVHFIDRGVINVVLEPIRQEFRVSDTQLGLLSGLAYGAATALAGLPVGYLVDRINRRNLLGILLLSWSGLTFLGGLSSTFGQLLASRIAVGAAGAGASPTSMSMIADNFHQTRRSNAISLLFFSSSVGTVLVYILGGLIADHYGWRTAFLVAGAPGLALALLLLLTVREPVRGAMEDGSAKTQAGPSPGILEVGRFALKQTAFLHILAALVLHAAVSLAFSIWVMSLMVRVHHIPLAKAAIVVGLMIGIAGGVGALASGWIADRLGQRKVTWLVLMPAVTATLTAVCGAIAALSTSALLTIGMLAAFQVFARGYLGAGYNLSLSLMKPRMRGFSMATTQIFCNLIGSLIGPSLVGVLSDTYPGQSSLQWAVATVMGLGVWASLHFVLASRTLRRDLDRAAAG